jgi:hypothetical protein
MTSQNGPKTGVGHGDDEPNADAPPHEVSPEVDLDALVQAVKDEVGRARASEDASTAWWRDPDLDPTDPDALTIGNPRSLKGRAKDVAKRGVGLQLRAARRQAGRYGLATQDSVDELETQLARLQAAQTRADQIWSVLAAVSPGLDRSDWATVVEAHAPSAHPTLVAACRADQFDDSDATAAGRLGNWYVQAPPAAKVADGVAPTLETPGRRGSLRTHLGHIQRGELAGIVMLGVLDVIAPPDRLQILDAARRAVPAAAPLSVVVWHGTVWAETAGVLAEDLAAHRPWRVDTWRAIAPQVGWSVRDVEHHTGFDLIRLIAA